jgi:hypothetical protein
MKINNQKRHVIDFIFPVALFFVFAVSSLIVVLLATRIYKSTTEDSQEQYTSRTALSYISEKIRQNDEADTVSVGKLDDGDCLMLNPQGSDYTTYIYEHDGALKELSVKEGTKPSPVAGELILEVNSFQAKSLSDNLFRFTITTEQNKTHSVVIGTKSN